MKPLNQRVKECINIRSKMNDLGISVLDSIKKYNDIMNEYIRTGKSTNGEIPIPEINRRLIYVFNSNECTVTLKNGL